MTFFSVGGSVNVDLNELTYKDRSEFLRGFSVIMRKNNCSNVDEMTMFSIIGKSLGFEKEFCDISLEHLGINKYISEKPAVFTDKQIAEFFINDITKLLFHSNSMSDAVVEWLRQTAKANEVDFII